MDLNHDGHEGDVQQNFDETWKAREEPSTASTLSKVKRHRILIRLPFQLIKNATEATVAELAP